MAKSVSVSFDEKEVAATLQLIDLAQKAGGLQVSEACVALMLKFRSAIERAKENDSDSSDTLEAVV